MENLIQMFHERCLQDSSETAFLTKRDGKWDPVTWSGVQRQSDQIAAGLMGLGLTAGDTVCILGNTRLEWTLCDLGAICAGCVSIGIYQTLSGEQSAYILQDSNSKVLFVENDEQYLKVEPHFPALTNLQWVVTWDGTLDKPNLITLKSLMDKGRETLVENPNLLKQTAEKVRTDDTAIIIYTSGTTGPPKGACLSHKNILAELNAAEVISEDSVGDIMMFFLPLAHVGERVAGQYMRIKRGVAAAYVEDITRILDDIVEIKPTFFGSVPRIFEKAYAKIRSEVDNASPVKQKLFGWAESVGRDVSRLKQKNQPLPAGLKLQYAIADRLVFAKIRDIFGGRVKYFLSSSAPIAIDIIEFFHACGMLILEGYGQTEVSCFCTLCTPDAYRFGSVGKAFPGVKLKIAEDGEVMVKGDIVFKGYLNQPELNRQTLTEDGWIYTGDIGKIDEDGYLWITGRKKEIIVTSGGKNVTPSNIEFLLMGDPLVELAMVHGDRRNYLTALISLSPENLVVWGEKNGYPGLDFGAYTALDEIRDTVQKIVDSANSRLARYETIKKFAIIPQPLQVETGELTPTMKVRRNIVEAKYKHLLDAMYG